jgi:hypothetical protein
MKYRRHPVAAFAAVVIIALGGCVDSRPPGVDPPTPSLPLPDELADLPRETRIGNLTQEQHHAMCQWVYDLMGGPQIMCGDGTTNGDYYVEVCDSSRRTYGPECPATLGQFVVCHAIKEATCREGMTERDESCDHIDGCRPWD